jgi:predicted transcriptional regulator
MESTGIYLTTGWMRFSLAQLTASESTVFMCLLCFMNINTAVSCPSYSSMIHLTNMSRSSISRAINKLSKLGVLEVSRTSPSRSQVFGNNKYTFITYKNHKLYKPEPIAKPIARTAEADIDALIAKEFHLD